MDRGLLAGLAPPGASLGAQDDPASEFQPTALMDRSALPDTSVRLGSEPDEASEPDAMARAAALDSWESPPVQNSGSPEPPAESPAVELPGVVNAAPAPSLPSDLPNVLGAHGLPELPAAPVPVGGHQGEREDVDGILGMLRERRIFEPPAEEPLAWAPKAEARPTRTRVGRVLAVVWALSLLLAGGGWYGYTRWVESRHAQAGELVAQARQEAFEGDHASLVDAERHLRLARELNSLDATGPTLMLFVYAQRSLEDGAFEAGYLAPAIARVERMHVESPWLPAARATMAIGHGNLETARSEAAAALEAGPEDPVVLYLVGRVEQRLGDSASVEHLAAAVQAAPELAAASLALAELRSDEGRPEESAPLLDAVLERYPGHLRGALWKAFLTADEADPVAARSALVGLTAELQQGAPTDEVLAHLTRAHLLRRSGPEAEAEVDAAAGAGATEPRLLAMVASEAMAIHQLPRAQQAAMEAVEAAPTIPEFRQLLARILLARRDGLRALRILANLSPEDPQVLALSARAALLVRTVEALRASDAALTAALEATEDPSVELRALSIETKVALHPGQARQLLASARRLARDAAGDPDAARALGETALAMRDPALATRALERLVASAPDDSEGYYLLGRAQRMAGDAEQAEASYRAALEHNTNHVGAKTQLAYLLLDLGRFAEAETLFSELSQRSVLASGRSTVLTGRLGRVEALLGLGRIDDAQVQLEAVREQDRERPLARVTAARVHLAQRRPGEAIRAIQALARDENASADVIALYGDALYQAQNSEQAMAQYERALALDRGHPEALLGYARVLLRADKAREARAILDRAEASLGRRIRAPSLGARLALLRGRAALLDGESGLATARAAFRRATAIEHCPPAAWFWLGESLAGDNAPSAREAYEHYLELAPAGPLAARARRAIR
ncbi:MAG: tetratricopeptide repeat protein [Deltaproteobacteria bacterium]|nr:tetratricopeptide repeat protein [Deltaproteobacteria bacterium]